MSMTEEAARPLAGKVALVAGASRNLGRAVAEALAAKGADVALHHHGDEGRAGAEAAAEAVRSHGGRAVLVRGDLTDVARTEALFDEARGALGRLDVFVNTAGVMLKKPLVEVTEEEYDRMFAIHTRAAFFALRAAARRIEDGGRIINVSTTLTSVTTPFYTVYAGAKSAVEQFTRGLAKEIGHRGVTVNAVAPGPLDTSFFHGAETPESVAFLRSLSVAGRLGTLDEVAPVVAFLASPEAGWITGQTVRVNGGMF